MNTVLATTGSYAAARKSSKSCKFFCRGLDIRVAEIMKSYPLYTRPLNSGRAFKALNA